MKYLMINSINKSINITSKFYLFVLPFIFLLISGNVKAQYDIPEKPKSDLSLIFDYSGSNLISNQEKQALNQKLIDYELKTSTQIVIIIVNSLNGEDPNYLAAQWAHKWGVGQKGKDNGMIILMSATDRKISIQNGYGLEEYITDARSRQIIQNIIIPNFKRNNYYKGLNNALDAIFSILDGTFTEDGTNTNESNNPAPIIIFIIIFFILMWIISKNNGGNGGGNRGRRNSTLGDIIFTDFGRSSWPSGRGGGFGSSGGFGSGGFGGFGGGGFGGGGASGSW